jgi:hypothetical protein
MAASVLLLAACGTAPVPTSPHEGLAETPQEKLARVRAGISQVRGLDFIEPVEAEYLTTRELTDYLQGLMGEDEREELRQLDELLTLLGLIDTDVDLVNLYLDLLYEGVLGAYDSEEGRLVVRLEGDALGPGEELTLAHELTHALQQQHFDIDSLLEETGDNFDRGLAVTALAEGDATLSELLYLQANSLSVPSVPDMPVYNSAPAIIQDLLIFPYAAGLRMVTQNFGEEDWSDVNAAYEDPPQSTEQVIHPEKYLEGEAPLQVALPEMEDALGPGWTLIYSSVGGEFLLRHYLGLQLRTEDVDEVASGWGGDAFALYGDATDQRLLLWAFRWDSTDDAEEFFEGYSELTENEGAWSDISQGASYSQWGRPNRWVYLQGSGDYVSVIIAPTRELAAKLAPLLANP